MEYLAVGPVTFAAPTLDDPVVATYERHEHHWQIEILRPEKLRTTLKLNSAPARGRSDEPRVREMISTWLDGTSGRDASNGGQAA